MNQIATKQKPITQVVTGIVRLNYVNVFEPRTQDGQRPRYSVTILIPKSDQVTMDKIKQAIDTAKQIDIWRWGGKIPTDLKDPVHDGDGQKPNGGEYGEECMQCNVINASSKFQPGIVDQNLIRITDRSEVYSGIYARVVVRFFPYNNENKGIGCELINVQKIADGEPLGGRNKPEDDFNDGADFGSKDVLR